MELPESRGQSSGNKVIEFIAVEPLPRPRCPRCGSGNIRSRGDTWRCVDCGKSWIKNAEYCPHCGQMMRRLTNG